MDTGNPRTSAAQNGRAYRSKKQRPCDICRSRRVQCKSLQLPDGSRDTSLCQMCVKLGLNCTFVQGPPRKRCRDVTNAVNSANAAANPIANAASTEAAHTTTQATVAGPSRLPSDSPHHSTSTNGNRIDSASHNAAHIDPHGVAMGVEPLWFPGNMPSASHMVADDTAASVALAMEPDHMAMMNWWTTMETPPQSELQK